MRRQHDRPRWRITPHDGHGARRAALLGDRQGGWLKIGRQPPGQRAYFRMARIQSGRALSLVVASESLDRDDHVMVGAGFADRPTVWDHRGVVELVPGAFVAREAELGVLERAAAGCRDGVSIR